VKSMRGLLVTMLLLTTPAALAGEEILAQRSDRYDVQWGDISLGEGVVSLKLLEGNCYRYESQTHPIALVRWTYGSPRETSEFCIENGEVHSRRFEFKNDKRSKDSFTLEFDWKLKQVKLIQGGTVTVRDLPGLAYDRFVIREAVRLWVKHLPDAAGRPEQTFTMIDEDRVRSYRFAVTGKERISTPAGRTGRQPEEILSLLAGAESRLCAGQDRAHQQGQGRTADGSARRRLSGLCPAGDSGRQHAVLAQFLQMTFDVHLRQRHQPRIDPGIDQRQHFRH
jgi:hypothetical protein